MEAIKSGTCHYLAKPSNIDDIEAALRPKATPKSRSTRGGNTLTSADDLAAVHH
jgi:ActR/RegA family two-component response regulator